MPLGADWALRRDFAVRSAGFPVTGLDAFGGDDEGARLRNPQPKDCWLELDGERYTSELRITAVDLTRRGQAKIEVREPA